MSIRTAPGALPPFDVNLLTFYQGYAVGTSQANTTSVGSGVTAMVSPATNVSGLIIRSAIIMPSGNTVYLYTGSAAPSGAADVNKPCLMASTTALNLPYPRFLPAGWGVWVTASAGGGFAALCYDPL
jgi:L-aminopeptidase/D-esterase-like protein